MVSTRPPTSKTSRPFSNPLVTEHTNHNWFNRYFHVPQVFYFSSKVEVLILFFTFLQIYSVVRRDSKVDNFADSLFFFFFFFFGDYYEVWSFGRDEVIGLYVKVPEEFMRSYYYHYYYYLHF